MSDPRPAALTAASLTTRTALAALLCTWLHWLTPDPTTRFTSPAMLAWLSRAALLTWAATWTHHKLTPTQHHHLWWAHRTIDLALLAAVTTTTTTSHPAPHTLTLLLLAQTWAATAHRTPHALMAWRGRAWWGLAALAGTAAATQLTRTAWQGNTHSIALVLITVAQLDVIWWLCRRWNKHRTAQQAAT